MCNNNLCIILLMHLISCIDVPYPKHSPLMKYFFSSQCLAFVAKLLWIVMYMCLSALYFHFFVELYSSIAKLWVPLWMIGWDCFVNEWSHFVFPPAVYQRHIPVNSDCIFCFFQFSVYPDQTITWYFHI